jgi:tetratricopeptide (TPR) repeat protein
MKPADLPRFDIDAVRDLAGEKVFARGEAYHRGGQVAVLSIEPERVLAQVAGTDDYRTVLMGRGKVIDGECTCPAFDDWGFCKHMVATALAANAADGEAETDGIGALARIRAHLTEKGVGALVEMIMHIAERDSGLFRRLDMAAAAVHADDKTLQARLRKAIDGATRTGGFVDYREAAGWAVDVDSTLDALADLVSGGRASLAMDLAERAIERIELAVEHIDDSDGHCNALLNRARDIHLAAARAVRPEPVQFARKLFVREMDGDYGTFDGAVALYADVLGEKGLAEYRRLAAEAWTKLPPRSGDARKPHEFSIGYDRLKNILDFFAEREGDLEARIALRAKDLSSPWSYLQLVEFCLSQGGAEEALRRAEEGLWLFEDGPPDERLVLFAVDLLLKAGRNDDAQAQLWRAFEKAPNLALYERLRQLGGETACGRAVEFLKTRLANEQHTHWHFPADLLIRILIHETSFDAAWAARVRPCAAPQSTSRTATCWNASANSVWPRRWWRRPGWLSRRFRQSP